MTPAIETTVTRGARQYVCREFPLHVATVRGWRRMVGTGERAEVGSKAA